MQLISSFLIFLLAAYAIAFVLLTMMRTRTILFKVLRFVASLSIMFTPILIPSNHVMARALAAFIAVDLFFKTIDYARQHELGKTKIKDFAEYAKFLIPFPILLVRFDQRLVFDGFCLRKCLPALPPISIFVLLICLVFQASKWELIRSSFFWDHTLKFVIFVIAIESLAKAILSVEHAIGFATKPLIVVAYQSQSVGEFWYRYNTRVHSWLEFHVFNRFGGRKRPVKAVFVTFLLSGAIHEIGFSVATSRIDGYQFIFFAIQAPAIIASRGLQRIVRRLRIRNAIMHGTTIFWMWASSILFFHGVNRVFPFFYASTPLLP